jgi:hypothetical protein
LRLCSNDTIKVSSLNSAKVNKITRDAIDKGYSFQKYKVELLKDKRLEEVVMKEINKPSIVSYPL